MKVRSQQARLFLLVLFVLCAWEAPAAELRTWTFSQDGQMRTSADGTVSFRKKGRLDAAFIRLETNNLVLLATRAGYVTIASTNLSELDRSYLARAAGIDDMEAARIQQSSVVRNEMARRRREAGKLRDEAAAGRRLAQVELDAADNLENEAARLAVRAGSLEIQAQSQETTADSINNSPAAAPLAGLAYVKSKSNATIAAGAADQLEQDIARLRHQAQDKRDRAAKLQREAATLEHTADSEEANSMPRPATAR